MSEEKKASIKKIQATGLMRKIMADYFYELDRASKAGTPKVAWCNSVGPAELLMSLGFLVAGMRHDIDEIVEYTRGMAHLSSSKVIQHEFRCVLIHGSLDQWKIAVVEGCKSHQLSTARQCFNQIYTLMLGSGLHSLFEGLHSRPNSDGTFLLLERK